MNEATGEFSLGENRGSVQSLFVDRLSLDCILSEGFQGIPIMPLCDEYKR